MLVFFQGSFAYQFFYGVFKDTIALEMVIVFFKLWFIWLPISFIYVFAKMWLAWVQNYYIWNEERVLLEIKVPREMKKTPAAMEAVFAALYEARKPNYYERFWEGFVPAHFSFEIASLGGKIHFYVECPKFFKPLVESHLYSQFTGLEIREAEDYTSLLPRKIPNQEWDLRGIEFDLEKEDAFPILTYLDVYETKLKVTEEVKEHYVDPLNSLFEFLGAIKQGEHIWFQVLIESAGNEWYEEVDKLHQKLTGKKRFQEAAKETPRFTSPEESVLKAIARATTKPGFRTGFRVLYLARREVFSPLAFAAVQGIVKQFNSPTLNSFRISRTTRARYFFKKWREADRKKRMLNAFRERSYFHYPYIRPHFILNTEELATIYHFPVMFAEVPALERIESRKMKPPPFLPI